MILDLSQGEANIADLQFYSHTNECMSTQLECDESVVTCTFIPALSDPY
jgi:hypothetical protein